MAIRKPTPQEIYDRAIQAISEGRWQTAQRLLEALSHIAPHFQDTTELLKFVNTTIKASQKPAQSTKKIEEAKPASKPASKIEPTPAAKTTQTPKKLKVTPTTKPSTVNAADVESNIPKQAEPSAKIPKTLKPKPQTTEKEEQILQPKSAKPVKGNVPAQYELSSDKPNNEEALESPNVKQALPKEITEQELKLQLEKTLDITDEKAIFNPPKTELTTQKKQIIAAQEATKTKIEDKSPTIPQHEKENIPGETTTDSTSSPIDDKNTLLFESFNQEYAQHAQYEYEEVNTIKEKLSFKMTKRKWYVLLGIIILFMIGLIILSEQFTPSKPLTMAEKMQTLSPPTATFTSSPTPEQTSTVPSPTITPTMSMTFTNTPIADTETPLPTATLGIGSIMFSQKDGMAMVYVPQGEFLMGPAKRKVYLDAFWIDQTEVTNEMYIRCIEEDFCSPPSRGRYKREELAKHPVIWVNWFQAQGYCRWAGKRLPTEAEWEKAARGTDGRMFPWGDTPPNNTLANVCDQSCPTNWSQKATEEGLTTTVEVGKYPLGASPYGAYDMAGNVWEWVADWYDESVYYTPPLANPTGAKIGKKRVIRGGSWTDLEAYIRTYNRDDMIPQYTLYNIGFRCALSP